MPTCLAASQIVVPSGTVTGVPSMVRSTVCASVAAGTVVAIESSIPSVDKYVQRRAGAIEPARVVVRVDHRIEPLGRQRGGPAGGELEWLLEQPPREAVVGAGPALAQVVEPLGEDDPPCGRAQLARVHVPAGDRAEQARPLV